MGDTTGHIHPWSNGNAPGRRILGRQFDSWSMGAGGGTAAVLAAPGFEPPTKKSALPALPFGHCQFSGPLFSPLLGPVSATDKKPKVCVSV